LHLGLLALVDEKPGGERRDQGKAARPTDTR
jgi:hypothetical protein